ncbi:hypothetical protein Si034_00908 [Streptococcus infantarius subsp. infantarius]|nr:hypothetical protein [Streptococcus infantarius subsp. infantarius]MCO4543468.1 hypothetical protein [Streptococcus infantarius subsp. infantarius]MCO4637981.1 hypothetical protein [Streptococcus infantarius subsp. infantarius]
MIKITYYNKDKTKLGQDTIYREGPITTKLLANACQKCILQGFDHYIANDSYGNHIKEAIEY